MPRMLLYYSLWYQGEKPRYLAFGKALAVSYTVPTTVQNSGYVYIANRFHIKFHWEADQITLVQNCGDTSAIVRLTGGVELGSRRNS